jgi:hypothetical protein
MPTVSPDHSGFYVHKYSLACSGSLRLGGPLRLYEPGSALPYRPLHARAADSPAARAYKLDLPYSPPTL